MGSPCRRYKLTNLHSLQTVQTEMENVVNQGKGNTFNSLKPAPALGLYRMYGMLGLLSIHYVGGYTLFFISS